MVGERKPVTILFADIVGSTSHAEHLDPEDWKEIVSGAHRAVSDAVYRYEGHVAQLLGDGVLAYFGAPIAHEDDPLRAVQAAVDIHEAIDELALDLRQRNQLLSLQMRVGVNSGLVVLDRVGSKEHQEYLAVGDAVNVAARLQSAAAPGRVVLSESTYQSVQGRFVCVDLGPLELKGKSESIRAFEVRGVRQGGYGRDWSASSEGRLIGRDHELEILGGVAEAATSAHLGQLVLIIAEPGLGKTRLVREWQAGPSPRDGIGPTPRWAVANCLSFGHSFAYHLLASLVRALLEVSEHASGAAVRQKVMDVAGAALGDAADETADVLAHLVGGSVEVRSVASPGDEHSQGLQNRYLAAVRRLLLALSAQAPVIAVLEDIHWADPSSTDVLVRLLPVVLEAPVVFCLTGRPEEQAPGWALVDAARNLLPDRVTTLTLVPLSLEQSRDFVLNLTTNGELPEELQQSVYQKSEGNPLFLEEVVRLLQERRAAGEGPDVSVPSTPGQAAEVPATLQRLLLARIDRLSDQRKLLVRVASAVGRNFDVEILHAVLEEVLGSTTREAMAAELEDLVAQGLLSTTERAGRAEYMFRHALIQEVTYDAVLKADRRKLHELIAAAMIRFRMDSLEALASTLAFHYERAEAWPSALAWLSRAAQRALEQWALPETIDLSRRALRVLDIVGPDPMQEFELRFGLAKSMMFLGQSRDQILEEYERCLALATDDRQRVNVHFRAGELLHIYTSSDLRAAEAHYRLALDLLRQDQNGVLGTAILSYLGYVYRYQKLANKAVDTLHAALRRAQTLGSPRLQADCHIFLSGAYLDLGMIDEALSAALKGLTAAAQSGDFEMLGRAHSFCSDVYLSRAYMGEGEAEDAVHHLQEMIRIGKEYGIGVLFTFGLQGMGAVAELRGDFASALELWRSGGRQWQASRAHTRAAATHAKCGQLLLQLGREDEATTLFENVRRELGDESSRAELYVGLAYAAAGRDRDACAHLQSAFETAPSEAQRIGWISMIRTEAEYRAARSLPGVSVLLDRFGEEE